MKFIIDENISPDVAILLRKGGLDAHHVNELKSNQKQRVVDDQLRRLSIRKGYIIVTKDDDFVKSYVHREVPQKLVFIHGIELKGKLIARLKELAPKLEELVLAHDFIEISQTEIKFPFSS